jgi:hypothetical protein
MLTGLHALTALDAGHGLGAITLGYNANAAQVFIKLFVKRLGASLHAGQASHTGFILLNSELLHGKELSFFMLFSNNYYTHTLQKNQHKNRQL